MSDKKILLSGVKPTGRPHVGNYFGAMKQFVELQDDYEAYIFIADLHALTSLQNKKELEENTIGVLLDYMAIGLDPKKVTLYKQSDVPQVTELAWIFNCITSVSYLFQKGHAYTTAKLGLDRKIMDGVVIEDIETGINIDIENKNDYKDNIEKLKRINEITEKALNIGVFDYPLLMAADILIQDANSVPVGKDQKHHIEIARDSAEKFNRIFGETFTMPEGFILDDMATIPGTDGRKMSKSYNNTIPLFGSDEELEKAVMSIVTDSGSDVPTNVYAIHSLLRNKNDLEVIYAENKGQYQKLKELLLEDLKAFITPMREKRQALKEDKNAVLEVLKAGGKVARERAEKKMEEVREKVGLKLY